MSSEKQKFEYQENFANSKETIIALCQELKTMFPNFEMKLDLEPTRAEGEDQALKLEIPKQKNLKFEVSIYVWTNSEEDWRYFLYLSVNQIGFAWSPFDENGFVDMEVVHRVKDVVVGLLKGDYRVVETHRGVFCIEAEIQRSKNETWEALASSGPFGLVFLRSLPVTNIRILQNTSAPRN
jgi:hypothetical protein